MSYARMLTQFFGATATVAASKTMMSFYREEKRKQVVESELFDKLKAMQESLEYCQRRLLRVTPCEGPTPSFTRR